MTNLVYILSSFSVELEVRPVVTVLQVVFAHPMIAIVSPLCCYTCHAVLRDQINLEPLIGVLCGWFPGSVAIITWLTVKSGIESGKEVIPF